jgi:hypothetical protein
MPTSVFTRTLKRWIARVMACVLLLAQFSIAAYACPAMAMADEASMAAPADRGGPDSLDDSAPNLCAAHCQYGQQSADHAAATIVPAALPTALYTLPTATDRDGLVPPPPRYPPVQAAAPPPLAILHCCFRI